MTKADAAKLVAIVVTAYPNYDKFKDEAAVTATVSLWATMFQADDGRIVALALNKHIATSKWPPSVAEIRELMLEIQHPELITPERAWLAVGDLLYTTGEHNYGDLYRQLPPLVARAVEAIGWGNLYEMHRSYCRGGKPGMDRVAFMDIYKPMYEREKQRAMTPQNLTAQIDAVAASLPDKGQHLLTDREQDRRGKEEQYRRLEIGWRDQQREAWRRLSKNARSWSSGSSKKTKGRRPRHDNRRKDKADQAQQGPDTIRTGEALRNGRLPDRRI